MAFSCFGTRGWAVIHLRTASAEHYSRDNPLRRESAREAAEIDGRILEVWAEHPHRVLIDSTDDFFDKAQRALDVIRDALPPCCRDSSGTQDQSFTRAQRGQPDQEGSE